MSDRVLTEAIADADPFGAQRPLTDYEVENWGHSWRCECGRCDPDLYDDGVPLYPEDTLGTLYEFGPGEEDDRAAWESLVRTALDTSLSFLAQDPDLYDEDAR